MKTHSIFLGKIIKHSLKTFNLGNGSTWPGHIALSQDPNFIADLLEKNPKLQIIIIAGTNGKTTTSLMIKTILEKSGKRVFQNESGANLLNGIASTLISHASVQGNINYDIAIFEVDEYALPLVLKQITPNILVLLNLFRDQLDRYGELNTIQKKWSDALFGIKNAKKTILIANADDPRIAYLGVDMKSSTKHFALQPLVSHKNATAADSLFCPHCNAPLTYSSKIYSHLGIWKCRSCGLSRPHPDLETLPVYPLDGTYNKYNTHAAVLTTEQLGVKRRDALAFLKDFTPAFGRQEKIKVDNKYVQIFLSKNPASFDQSLETIMAKNPKQILFVLNDKIPDGRDVSWIWDTQIEQYDFRNIGVISSGDRAYDMALRIKYAFPFQKNQKTRTSLTEAILSGLAQLSNGETLYILPTYSAMLEIRKIITGRKIL